MNILIDDFNCDQFIDVFKRALLDLNKEKKVDLCSLIQEMNSQSDIWAILFVVNKRTIAFIQFQIVYLSNDEFMERVGFIREFWIEPQHRQRGIGTKLLKDCEIHLSGLGINQFILLSLPKAENFYKKQGYILNENYISFNNLNIMTKNRFTSEKVSI